MDVRGRFVLFLVYTCIWRAQFEMNGVVAAAAAAVVVVLASTAVSTANAEAAAAVAASETTSIPEALISSWMNDTIPIPPYMGLNGSQQAGLVAGYFIFTVVLTVSMILALFNPCKASCKDTCARGGGGDGAECYSVACCCCCCCPSKEENWCYLCCSVILLRIYFACCCRRCCRRSSRWASKRADTLKEVFQQELESSWQDFERGGEEDTDDDPNGVLPSELGEPRAHSEDKVEDKKNRS